MATRRPAAEPQPGSTTLPAVGTLLDRKLVFVTGKGGVGKTSVAAALAQLAASQGRRTLACEVDAKGDLAAAIGAPRSGFEATAAGRDLWLMAMDTEASLREYLKLNLHVPVVTRLGPLARTFDFVADAAPGVKEILSVGKLAWEVRQRHYDLVVADAPASGHVIAHLAAPEVIKELVHVGPIRGQTEWMLDILSDPVRTGVVIVTTPEELPVTETIELAADVANRTPAHLAAVVANRVLPELFNRREEELFDQLGDPGVTAALAAVTGEGTDAVLGAARLIVGLRRRAASQLAELREALPGTPVLYLPEQFGRLDGPALTATLAGFLADELG